ncbi:MAG: GNAT family N-acetyltransferase, partial [Clostridia bacterium]
TEIIENKKQYLELLLLADEQESMVDKYLERGEMFVLSDNGVKAECVVTDEGNGVCEIKNFATAPEHQRKGYGRQLLGFVCKRYGAKYFMIQVGTSDSERTIQFYQSCGFVKLHKIKNFFVDNYDHAIYEDGKQLVDMIYLYKFI